MSRLVFFIWILFLLFPAGGIFANGDSVRFSEVAWMGTLPSGGESSQAASNNEWMELYNPLTDAISLEGWKIVSQDGMPDITLSGRIPSGGYFLLERGSDLSLSGITADLVYGFKNNSLANDGERLFLKNSVGGIVDEINALSGWPAGDNESKQTMQKSSGGWITASATPKSGWIGATTSPNTSVFQPPPNSTGVQQSIFIYPSIKAYAGEDKVMITGSEIEFLGQAWNSKNELLEDIRFWWNFGDGSSKEGRAVSHIFQIPGKYMVGLHISDGSSAASDYVLVEAIANQLKITEVLLGESGYFKFYNPSDLILDIGGWIVESASGRRFTIPIKTKIGPKAEIAFANSLSKLFIEEREPKIFVRYPNGVLALERKGDDAVAQQSVNTANQVSLVQNHAPGIFKEDSLTKTSFNPIAATTSGFAGVSETRTPYSGQKALTLWLAGGLSLIVAVGYLLVRKWQNQKL